MRRDNHLTPDQPVIFLEVEISDASDFAAPVSVAGSRVGQHRILHATGTSVPNVLAAVLLRVRGDGGEPPHVYFEWSERPPGINALRFLLAGEGDIAPLTHEVLRRAEPDALRRPQVHAGG